MGSYSIGVRMNNGGVVLSGRLVIGLPPEYQPVLPGLFGEGGGGGGGEQPAFMRAGSHDDWPHV